MPKIDLVKDTLDTVESFNSKDIHNTISLLEIAITKITTMTMGMEPTLEYHILNLSLNDIQGALMALKLFEELKLNEIKHAEITA